MTEGESIRDLEWDILLVLDACRFDYFKEHNDLPGRLGMIESDDSCTIEWLVGNFPEKYDIIYVSGSPFVNTKRPIHNYYAPDHFEHVIDVWNWGFDNDLDTVHPRTVCNSLIQALQVFKPRFIAHFMQPHTSYIGEHTFPAPSWRRWRIGNLEPPKPQNNEANLSTSFSVKQKDDPFTTVKKNVKAHKEAHPHGHEVFPLEKFTEDHLKAWRLAYADNLKLALTEIERLLTYIDPEMKVVITSDHGEILGEDGDQWHPCDTANPILNNVPWFEVDMRPDLEEEEEDIIKERLARLGYIE